MSQIATQHQRNLPAGMLPAGRRKGLLPNEVYSKGDRPCANAPECITILCIYNPGPRCYRCTEQVEAREFAEQKARGERMIARERRAAAA